MGFFDKKTICEICFNDKCSDKGKRNLHRGYDPKACASFKKSKEEVVEAKKVESTEYDDMDYSTHHDPNYWDEL
jgi:hypothetical protein